MDLIVCGSVVRRDQVRVLVWFVVGVLAWFVLEFMMFVAGLFVRIVLGLGSFIMMASFTS